MSVTSVKLKIPPKRKIINRLFLVGNGFDLSLGLKTKYSDFLLWLLKKYISKALNSNVNYAPFEKYKGEYDHYAEGYNRLKVYGFYENNLFDILLTKNITFNIGDIEEVDSLIHFYEQLHYYGIEIKTPKASLLMNMLLNSSKDNWVDIENTYFELLKEIIRTDNSKRNYKDVIIQINSELTHLTTYLKEYLTTLKIEISKENSSNYYKQFNEDLDKQDFIELEGKQDEIKIGKNYFLNFNYTNSLDEVLKHFNNYKFIPNFIHGKLEDDEIVFGFGDEMDSIYKEIEELNDNRFFKHIKSFHYFKKPNLRHLITFLNSGEFQVCIYGHSCGLSDRVMLNEIFEHENCKSIKIYYYNDDDFTTKTMEISRHFNSNQVMRKRIVNKSTDCLIPQMELDKV